MNGTTLNIICMPVEVSFECAGCGYEVIMRVSDFEHFISSLKTANGSACTCKGCGGMILFEGLNVVANG